MVRPISGLLGFPNLTTILPYPTIIDIAITVLAQIFRAYLSEASMEHLSNALKKGGIKDLQLFFPPNKRDDKTLEEFFRKEQLSQVADWWTKRQNSLIKEEVTKLVHDMLDQQDTPENVSPFSRYSGGRMLDV